MLNSSNKIPPDQGQVPDHREDHLDGEGSLEHALIYLGHNLPAIPVGWDKVKRGWKHPLVKWERYQTELPTESDLCSWWKKWPYARVGIVTGKFSDLVVVDIDPAKGGTTGGLDLPATLISKTGGGGWHYIYRHPSDRIITNGTDWPRKGIDIRGNGGFIVAPPSLHVSGKRYEWPLGFDPTLIAPCPSWLLEKGTKNKIPVSKLLKGVSEGGRNDAATRVIGRILRDLPEDEWENLGWPKAQTWNTKNTPPLDASELRAIFESISERERKRREQGDESGNERKSQASKLVDLVEAEDVTLFHSDLQVPFASFKVDGHYETRALDSRSFEHWLRHLYWHDKKQGVGSEAVKTAIGTLVSKAMYDGEEHKLFNRVAFKDNAFWYDLTDKEWRAVKITAEGWEIVDHPPILFQRYSHQAAQVMPVHGGDAKEFLRFFHLPDKDTQLLLLVAVLSYFVPEFPHPVLAVHGPHGSAKTTSMRLVRRLIDPSQVESIGASNDVKELAQILSHNYFIPLDNLSSISGDVSDLICRAVSGMGGFKRVLFTTDDDFIFCIRRCIGLNGINNIVSKPDLIERSIFIELGRITEEERNTEGEFWPKFEQALPGILGGCFDVIAKAMAIEPTLKLRKLPRMADFARHGCALTEGLGIDKQHFLDAYDGNLGSQNDDVMSEEPVAVALIAFAKEQKRWEGDYTKLLALLNALAEKEKVEQGSAWPKKANKLSQKINELTPSLALVGVYVTKVGKRTALIQWIEKRKDESGKQDDWDDRDDTFPNLHMGGQQIFLPSEIPKTEDRATKILDPPPRSFPNLSSQSSLSPTDDQREPPKEANR